MNSYPDRFESSADHLTADHLTADQIDDQLIGDLAPAPADHLAACSFCAERVATAASPFADFQNVSTSWSERRSATLPIPVPVPQRPIWQRHMAWATASLSLAFGIAFINATHQFSFSLQTSAPQPAPVQTARSLIASQPAAQPPATQQIVARLAAPPPPALSQTAGNAAAPRAAQISADNHLLRAVNASFDPSADSPAALGLMPATATNAGPPASI